MRFAILLLLLLPGFAAAVTLTDTYIGSVLINGSITFDQIDIDGSTINLTGLSSGGTFWNNGSTATMNFFTLNLPFNDIYNSTSGQILATNQTAYNVTLSPGDTIYVADYTSALNFSVIAPEATIRENSIPFSFSAVSNNGVPVSTYYFSDGTTNYTSPGTYTATAPGDYTFMLYAIDDIGSTASYVLTTTVTPRGSYMSDTSESLMTIVGFIGLIVAVIFGGMVLSMLKNDNFDARAMKDAVYIIVISMVVLGVGILIFSVFGQIG